MDCACYVDERAAVSAAEVTKTIDASVISLAAGEPE